MSDAAPLSTSAPRRVNYVALTCAVLGALSVVYDIYYMWSRTAGAITTWRINVVFEDVAPAVVITVGCAFAALGAPRARRAGTVVALLTAYGWFAWIQYVTR